MTKRLKFLSLDDYNKYFANTPPEHGGSIQEVPNNGECYFNFSTILPSEFFIDKIQVPDIVKMQLPRHVEVNFELIGKGNANGVSCAIFIPWVVGVHPRILDLFESVLLYMNEKLFMCLVQHEIFKEKIDYQNFPKTVVLGDVVIDAYKFFKLNFWAISDKLITNRLIINKLQSDFEDKISAFYEKNWSILNEHTSEKYFQPHTNAWFQISLKESPEIIGYIRIYIEENVFRQGPLIEYILCKDYRGQGYMIEALNSFIAYMKKQSTALSIYAEIESQNETSKKIIKQIGFEEISSSLNRNSLFSFYLLENTQRLLEAQYRINNVKISYLNKYKERIHRYL